MARYCKCVIGCFVALSILLGSALETVDELDIHQFMGRWFEIYTDEFVMRWENKDYCATRDYQLRDTGSFSVHYAAAKYAHNGTMETYNGYSFIPDSEDPGKLKLFYPQIAAEPYDYWILALGPLDTNGLYSYSITSNPTNTTMWVFARNVTEFFDLYNEEVLQLLEDFGFTDGEQAPVVSYQGDDCVYDTHEIPETVSELDMHKYAGLWYEMYTDNFVSSTWEKHGFCNTKLYSPRSEGRFRVENYEAMYSPNGTASTVHGYMVQNDLEEPGILELHFPEFTSQVMHYLVYALGPLNSNGLYSYAIFGGSSGTTMWVVARDVDEFKELYDAEVHSILEDLGFKGYGDMEPVATYQGDDCLYAVDNAPSAVETLNYYSFVGTYFEMYTDSFVGNTWESDTYCSQTSYTLDPLGGDIMWRNVDNKGSAASYIYEINEGVMNTPDSSKPAEFLLHVDGMPTWDYWVLALGPLDADEKYSYVVMGDSHGNIMWVLARNVSEFRLRYDEEVHQVMEDLGFKYGDKTPVETYQGSDCIYILHDSGESSGGGKPDSNALTDGEILGIAVGFAVVCAIAAGLAIFIYHTRTGNSGSESTLISKDEEIVKTVNPFVGGDDAEAAQNML